MDLRLIYSRLTLLNPHVLAHRLVHCINCNCFLRDVRREVRKLGPAVINRNRHQSRARCVIHFKGCVCNVPARLESPRPSAQPYTESPGQAHAVFWRKTALSKQDVLPRYECIPTAQGVHASLSMASENLPGGHDTHLVSPLLEFL